MKRVVLGSAVLVLAIACGDGSVPPDGGVDASLACRVDEDCDDGLYCNGVERCLGEDGPSCVAGEPPCTVDRCDESADSCSDCDAAPDADGDGRRAPACGGDDCDDTDSNRFPGNIEVCDPARHDEDCDPSTFGFRDGDGDGWADAACCNLDAAGAPVCGDDCDDARPASSPVGTEICDTRDNDCDGAVDEEVSPTAWYADADSDGYGDPLAAELSCTPLAGRVPRAGDCDDADAAIHPDAAEACDARDSDCDGLLDGPGEDDDRDGAADLACGGADCDDTDATVFPGARELCNRLDDDCSSGGGTDATEDADGDGLAPLAATCELGDRPRLDCDDTDPLVYRGATERCNGLDDDCSSGGGADALEDQDGDGHAPVLAACLADAFPRDDCDDTRASVYAGAPELCDGLDDDCLASTTVDVGCARDLLAGSGSSTTLAGTAAGTYFCEDDAFRTCGLGCPEGTLLAGFQVRASGGVLRQLTGVCRDVVVTRVPDMIDRYTVASGPTTLLTSYGSATGTATQLVCPAGEWVSGIAGNAGTAINWLEVRCSSARITGARGAYSVSTTVTRSVRMSGAPTTPSFNYGCGANRLSASYEGYEDGTIRGLAIFCESVSVSTVR